MTYDIRLVRRGTDIVIFTQRVKIVRELTADCGIVLMENWVFKVMLGYGSLLCYLTWFKGTGRGAAKPIKIPLLLLQLVMQMYWYLNEGNKIEHNKNVNTVTWIGIEISTVDRSTGRAGYGVIVAERGACCQGAYPYHLWSDRIDQSADYRVFWAALTVCTSPASAQPTQYFRQPGTLTSTVCP